MNMALAFQFFLGLISGIILTLAGSLLFLNWRKRKIEEEFERFNNFDDLEDQVEKIKKSFPQMPNFSSDQIDSMIKNFSIENKENPIEVKVKEKNKDLKDKKEN